jgi:flavin reductase (DIM6/NTAB) family NADH-FMN oxidoreductase RutF
MVAADFVGIVSAKNDSAKMQKAGWNAVKSEHVNAPVFTNFPMTLECRIQRKIDVSEEGYYIVAEIVNILVDEQYLGADGKPDINKMGFITYNPIQHVYHALGEQVGKAFSDGKALK